MLPRSNFYFIERSGACDPSWISSALQEDRPIPSKDHFWNLPAHSAIDFLSQHMSYFSMAHHLMEHSQFFFFDHMLLAQDAPLPHVLYNDFMKCLTFSSLQSPPSTHFSLPQTMLRNILMLAAQFVLEDAAYFRRVEMLMRQMEQQQEIRSEVLSAWVLCCVCGGAYEAAFDALNSMTTRGLEFDSMVFLFLMQPSIDVRNLITSSGFEKSHSILNVMRLYHSLSSDFGANSVALHAVIVFSALSMNPVGKWDAVMVGLENRIAVPPRTASLIFESLQEEGFCHCGPKTCTALCYLVVQMGTHLELANFFTRLGNDMARDPTLFPNVAEEHDMMSLIPASVATLAKSVLLRRYIPSELSHEVEHVVDEKREPQRSAHFPVWCEEFNAEQQLLAQLQTSSSTSWIRAE